MLQFKIAILDKKKKKTFIITLKGRIQKIYNI